MKSMMIIVLFVATSWSLAQNTWVWDRTLGKLRPFQNSEWVCVDVSGVDNMVCFDMSLPGGDTMVSVMLAAKMANARVDVYYGPATSKLHWIEASNYYVGKLLYLR